MQWPCFYKNSAALSLRSPTGDEGLPNGTAAGIEGARGCSRSLRIAVRFSCRQAVLGTACPHVHCVRNLRLEQCINESPCRLVHELRSFRHPQVLTWFYFFFSAASWNSCANSISAVFT